MQALPGRSAGSRILGGSHPRRVAATCGMAWQDATDESSGHERATSTSTRTSRHDDHGHDDHERATSTSTTPTSDGHRPRTSTSTTTTSGATRWHNDHRPTTSTSTTTTKCCDDGPARPVLGRARGRRTPRRARHWVPTAVRRLARSGSRRCGRRARRRRSASCGTLIPQRRRPADPGAAARRATARRRRTRCRRRR